MRGLTHRFDCILVLLHKLSKIFACDLPQPLRKRKLYDNFPSRVGRREEEEEEKGEVLKKEEEKIYVTEIKLEHDLTKLSTTDQANSFTEVRISSASQGCYLSMQ